MKDKIAIRFGHAQLKNGLKTSANGIINEYDTIREFGPYVISTLTRTGYDVVNVTPVSKKYTDGADDLQEGLNTAKLLGCSVFVSLHLNCFDKKARGSEVLHGKGAVKSKQLAECIQAEFINLGFINRGAKEDTADKLAELKQNNICVITEGFFIDNVGDVARYRAIGPQKFGEAIAYGIIKYLGGNLPAAKPEPQPVPLEKQYRVYGSKLLGNGLEENYARIKAQQLKEQGYVNVYYIKPDGTKINY